MGNQGDLNNYWIHSFGSLSGVPTNINWAKEMVAAINLGPRATAGYNPWVTSVDKVSAAEVRITWVERYPPSWANPPKTQQSPFQIIKLSRMGQLRTTFYETQSMPTPLALLVALGIGTKGSDNYYDCPWIGYNSGGLCQVDDFTTVIVSDQTTFEDYWLKSFGSGIPLPTDVDFTSEQLVALHLGHRPTTGYGAMVLGLKMTGPNEATVEWYEKKPAEGAVVAQHVTSPWTLVKIPQGKVKVVFKQVPPPKPKG